MSVSKPHKGRTVFACYLQHFAEDQILGKYWLMMHLPNSEGHGKPWVGEMTVAQSGKLQSCKDRFCKCKQPAGRGQRPAGEPMLLVRRAATFRLYACHAAGQSKSCQIFLVFKRGQKGQSIKSLH